MALRELLIKPDAHAADESCEILRGWVIDKRLQISLLPGAFPKPFGRGILLADVAHHIANALADSQGADRSTVLQDIARAFNVEMNTPTTEHSGGYVERSEG